ncbi:hypothetical protein [Xylophilus sp.]|nr:hypothetical protein [Xylophilus sp.]KAF1047782.1 MAG: hypothetical protein GAK38_01725 [Xylophilus sp.]
MRVVGTYFDTLARDASGRWRFAHRIFRVRYADDAPAGGQVFDDLPR